LSSPPYLFSFSAGCLFLGFRFLFFPSTEPGVPRPYMKKTGNCISGKKRTWFLIKENAEITPLFSRKGFKYNFSPGLKSDILHEITGAQNPYKIRICTGRNLRFIAYLCSRA